MCYEYASFEIILISKTSLWIGYPDLQTINVYALPIIQLMVSILLTARDSITSLYL